MIWLQGLAGERQGAHREGRGVPQAGQEHREGRQVPREHREVREGHREREGRQEREGRREGLKGRREHRGQEGRRGHWRQQKRKSRCQALPWQGRKSLRLLLATVY